ncbi:hypothetical protein [Vibrio gazogenes]|uniref:Uncharacterized protein n=1 Tax=Vibrio gazogenes DSM 21264 = NBRC 103151 TaxID=1123492 RepID=A0A1M4V3Z1_VIBGA|nr:hypothetical protein [Vibrio gazogenes]USP15621.1 hypothetical protein MKS89_19730 [Vibrio gazogenes]SHE63665.1 hypothetical protein SAMN02745781_00628 [Vibrio gazogenes DSM 21264] [Vibrio gazogenes DSM 21264 = NBRC 103151]SJN54647.1 hypothetical protein BQ6471_01131 [Vibrio gazogenes]
MNIISLSVVLLSIICVISVWHLNRVLSPDNSRAKMAVRFVGSFSIVLVLLSGINQFNSNNSAKNIRKYELDLKVGENLAERRISILDNYFKVYMRSVVVSNYSMYQAGIKNLTEDEKRTLSWDQGVLPKRERERERERELESARESFEILQRQAREILDLSIRYPHRVPKQMTEWAKKTLNIKFLDLPNYINAYSDSLTVINYAKSLGSATGEAIQTVRTATEKLEK